MDDTNSTEVILVCQPSDAETRERLAVLAVEIVAEHRAVLAASGSFLLHARAAGAKLIEAKAAVPFGTWLPWLNENCEMSQRTAQRYMRIAGKWSEIEASNPSRASDLSESFALALVAKSRTPDWSDLDLADGGSDDEINDEVSDIHHGGFLRPVQLLLDLETRETLNAEVRDLQEPLTTVGMTATVRAAVAYAYAQLVEGRR